MLHLSVSYVEINVVQVYIEADIMFEVLMLVKLYFMQCINKSPLEKLQHALWASFNVSLEFKGSTFKNPGGCHRKI